MRWLVGLSVIFCAFPHSLAGQRSDIKCVSWDDRIERDVFQPLREKLREFSSEYKDFIGADFDWHGWGVSWQGGSSGNYSSFRLDRKGSTFCQSSGERILSGTILYDDLRTSFEEVEFQTPFFNLGDYQPTIIFSGVKLTASINTRTSKQCEASLEEFLLLGFDSLHMEMSGGVSGWLITKLFNWVLSPGIAAYLKSYAENQSVTAQVKMFLAPAVKAQSDFFCEIVN